MKIDALGLPSLPEEYKSCKAYQCTKRPKGDQKANKVLVVPRSDRVSDPGTEVVELLDHVSGLAAKTSQRVCSLRTKSVRRV